MTNSKGQPLSLSLRDAISFSHSGIAGENGENFEPKANQWRTLNRLLGGGWRNFNYQDNTETDDPFKCHDTIKFIVKKVNLCCSSGITLQTFSLRLLGGNCPLAS